MTKLFDRDVLTQLLSPSGFVLSAADNPSSVRYSRPSEFDDLWEQLLIRFGGKKLDSVSIAPLVNVCYTEISARGLSESGTIFLDVGDDEEEKKHGVITLADRHVATRWLREVTRVCPSAAREYVSKEAPQLLTRTSDARQAVNKYMKKFGTKDWQVLRERFLSMTTTGDQALARCVARSDGTIQIRNGLLFYETIILGLMLYSPEVEGRQLIEGPYDPWPDWRITDPGAWALPWRMEILADRLIGRFPYPAPIEL